MELDLVANVSEWASYGGAYMGWKENHRRRITNDQKQIKEYIEMIFNIVTEKYNLRHEMILPEQFWYMPAIK
jgi:hypothetical protein